MADARYNFTHQEIIEALLRKAGITEGIWQLGVEFGFAASNVASDEKGEELKPAALIAVNSLTLSSAEKPSSLTVDASKLQTLK